MAARKTRVPTNMAKLTVYRRRLFMDRVEYDTNGGCWLWAGKVQPNGYGRTNYDMAHRASLVLLRGVDIPKGMHVMHRCDVRCCVNPDHLSVGTAAENIRDMDRKGRRVTVSVGGEKSGMSVLKEEDVREIRRRYESGEGLSALGRAFSVTPQNIRSITNRKTWRHI